MVRICGRDKRTEIELQAEHPQRGMQPTPKQHAIVSLQLNWHMEGTRRVGVHRRSGSVLEGRRKQHRALQSKHVHGTGDDKPVIWPLSGGGRGGRSVLKAAPSC